MCTLGLITSISRWRSSTVMVVGRNQANVEQETIASTEMDDLETIPSALRPVRGQWSLAGDPPTPTTNMVSNALANDLEVPGDVSIGENSRNEDMEQVEEENELLLEDLNA